MMPKFHAGQPNIEVLSTKFGKWIPVDILECRPEGGSLLCVFTKKITRYDVTYRITTEHMGEGTTTLVGEPSLRVRPNDEDKTSWTDMMNKLKDGVPA